MPENNASYASSKFFSIPIEKNDPVICEKYASFDLPNNEDTQSIYFPDTVIDTFTAETKMHLSEILELHTTSPDDLSLLKDPHASGLQIPLEQSKALIIEALNNFDPALGEKAEEILNDPKRLNLHENDGCMMRVRAAGLEMDNKDTMRLENAGLPSNLIDDLRSRYSDDENKEGTKAVIDFDYNGGIGATIYLAHELGHAIADDYQNDAGHSYKDNPKHMEETQAYFVQNIIYDHLKKQDDPKIAKAAEQFSAMETASNIYDLNISLVAMDALKGLEQGKNIDAPAIFEERLGSNWKKLCDNYPPAKETLNAITDLNEGNGIEALKTLGEKSNRIHFRPTSFLVGQGLASEAQEKSPTERKLASEMILGGHGPANINKVLNEAHINKQTMAQTTVEKLLNHLKQPKPNNPKIKPILKQQKQTTMKL